MSVHGSDVPAPPPTTNSTDHRHHRPSPTRSTRWNSPEHRPSSRVSRCSRWRSCSACPAARSCPSTTRSSTPRSATSWCATSRAPGTWPRGMPRSPVGPGVAMVTCGPGATNIVTPLADAYMDSTPLVVVTGQVATTAIGTDAFQESDITGDHHGHHQAQLADHRCRRHPAGRGRGVPRRDDRPTGSGPHRHPEGHRPVARWSGTGPPSRTSTSRATTR